MTCQQKDCCGEINTAVSKELIGDSCGRIFVRISFNPCKKCALLHYLGGMAAYQIGSGEGFFLENSEVVYREVVLV